MPEDWSTFGVDLHLELSSSSGRRTALERALRDAIRTRRLASGSRLPSTRALSAELGLSRGTVSAAYNQLVAEGYLAARTGSGTAVANLSQMTPSTPSGPADGLAEPRYGLRPGHPGDC